MIRWQQIYPLVAENAALKSSAQNSSIQEVVYTMKQTITAALAALMLAGALSAVSGATSVGQPNTAVVIGEGSAPMPTTLPPVMNASN